jgi:hypothetical protein
MSDDATTVRPFSNGLQYMDWLCNNCDECSKQADPDASLDEMPCEIERALAWACLDDGRIPLAIAERMGQTRYPDRYSWPCKERDPMWADWAEPEGV